MNGLRRITLMTRRSNSAADALRKIENESRNTQAKMLELSGAAKP